MGTRKGQPSPHRGKGRGLAWVKANVNHVGDECLIWPWSTNQQGYGQLGLNGKVYKAHRMMCTLAHGEAPSVNHDAAHSCGNGHLGCVNPNHLSWKSPRENRLDANAHGTGSRSRKQLNPEIVKQIRDSTKSYLEIAAEFGVYFGTVGKIKRGELYRNIPGRPDLTAFTDEEIAKEHSVRLTRQRSAA